MKPSQPYAFLFSMTITIVMVLFEFVIYDVHTEVSYVIPPMCALTVLFFYLTYIRKQ